MSTVRDDVESINIDGKDILIEEHFHVLGLTNEKGRKLMLMGISGHPTNMKSGIGIIFDSRREALEAAKMISEAAEDIFGDKECLDH